MARRMIVVFVLCALLPILCLAVVASTQVTRQLRAATQERLHQLSKSVGMDLIGELRRVESEMMLVESTMSVRGPGAQMALPERLHAQLAARFAGLAVVSNGAQPRLLLGAMPPLFELTPSELAHLETGKSVVTIEPAPGGPSRLFMRRLLTGEGGGEVLVAEINRDSFWKDEEIQPQTGLHVFGPDLDTLFTSFGPEVALQPDTLQALSASPIGALEWEHGGTPYIAASWSLPLRFEFLLPSWTILISQTRADVLAPIGSARVTFVLIILLSLWVVMLLSISQVRRSLVPLARLQEGTRRIGQGELDTNVDVKSGDEFEELAGSFNMMSRQLKRQFDTLSAIGELDRAVLSSLNVETIVRTVLDRLPLLVGCDHLAIVVTGRDSAARAFVKDRHGSGDVETSSLEVAPADARALLGNEHIIRVCRQNGVPSYLTPLEETNWTACAVLPMVFGDRLVGILALADGEATDRSAEELLHARQLADQVGVALSNADLVLALDRLNIGTLQALARTVDAKSPWTAGHSQRVTAMALDIARAMELGADELDTIARGGLLHDIGKIAVPSAILNKASKLTEEEFALVKEHPQTGARILEPIPEYSGLIPIVLQHHERFDGGGYPAGLAGEAISFEARIVAVADVFDALTSDRPYRKGMDLDRAVGIIRAESGSHFDPRMVVAFLTALDQRRTVQLEHAAVA